MKLFSERKGITKPRTELQIESMDDALKNCLWNVLQWSYFRHDVACESGFSDYPSQTMQDFLLIVWHSYFKEPTDTLPRHWSDVYDTIRKYFFKAPWYFVYDFIEFTVNNFPEEPRNDRAVEDLNSVLEKEMSGYRFVGRQITPITSKEEIAEVSEALETPYGPVNAHLESALKLFSDRKSPDYRNSIKESISSVEAMCRTITGDDKATLGKALDMIEREGKVELHGALKKAFDSLYGYTSSTEGIRHSLLDEEKGLSFEDAKFMLISCSAFVNYLVSKTSKAGLKKRQPKPNS
jgi:hypothetical protein